MKKVWNIELREVTEGDKVQMELRINSVPVMVDGVVKPRFEAIEDKIKSAWNSMMTSSSSVRAALPLVLREPF